MDGRNVITMNLGQKLISGLRQFAESLEKGYNIEYTEVRREETPDGPMHTFRKLRSGEMAWTSVEENLPPKMWFVLVWHSNGNGEGYYCTARVSPDGNWWLNRQGGTIDFIGLHKESSRVTHWTSLPKPPNKEVVQVT